MAAYSNIFFMDREKKRHQKISEVLINSVIAYGQMIDVAYIVDFKKKIEFFVSATIYCKANGILNDDKYEYSTYWPSFHERYWKGDL